MLRLRQIDPANSLFPNLERGTILDEPTNDSGPEMFILCELKSILIFERTMRFSGQFAGRRERSKKRNNTTKHTDVQKRQFLLQVLECVVCGWWQLTTMTEKL